MNEPEYRDHKKFNYHSRMGRSSVEIECPWCGAVVTAYLWSLAGGGKKCGCGALHNSFGTTREPKRKP